MDTRPHVSLILLAGASGAVDALAFTALGETFAGVMTGNLVLLGISAGQGSAHEVAGPLYALGGYAVGAAATGFACRGEHSERPAQEWPGRVVGCLAVQCLLLGFLAVAGGLLGGEPSGLWRTALLVVAALAMGGQSAAMVAAGSGAAPTTYFTGTLTTLLTGAVDGTGRGRQQLWVTGRLSAVVAGAACAVGLRETWAPWGFVPPVVLASAALACQKPAHRMRRAVTVLRGK
ncbi:YoaK family protein [Streptomyces sp. SDT5-1]|uniref:YoaK family protein n=1 Tax=Streptomyces sp. SDT5-1 TaxID=3406418 RepID=UPI003FD17BFF